MWIPVRLTVAVLVLVCLQAGASAAPQARVSAGVYGDVARFDRLTGQRTESGLAFLGWDQGRTWGKQYSYFLDSLGDRPHIALGTRRAGRGGALSPRSIALGRGDAHLVGLSSAISEAGKPVLLRPLGEPNNSANPYCACHGGSQNSTSWYRKAFQRVYVLMHGGSAAAMSAKLRGLGMPGIGTDLPKNPYPQMTVVWNPLAVGVPDVRGNHYRDYFPSLRFVDAYGNDYYHFGTYSFVRTAELYKAYPSKPYIFPEWGLAVDDPAYVRAFAGFVRSHRRVKFIGFYNGQNGGRLDLAKKPRSLAAYKRYIVPLVR